MRLRRVGQGKGRSCEVSPGLNLTPGESISEPLLERSGKQAGMGPVSVHCRTPLIRGGAGAMVPEGEFDERGRARFRTSPCVVVGGGACSMVST